MDALPLDVLGHLQRAKTALNNPEYVHDTKKLAAALTGELGLAWHKMTRSILKPFTEGDPFEALAPFQHQSNRPLHLVSQTLQNLMVPKVSKRVLENDTGEATSVFTRTLPRETARLFTETFPFWVSQDLRKRNEAFVHCLKTFEAWMEILFEGMHAFALQLPSGTRNATLVVKEMCQQLESVWFTLVTYCKDFGLFKEDCRDTFSEEMLRTSFEFGVKQTLRRFAMTLMENEQKARTYT